MNFDSFFFFFIYTYLYFVGIVVLFQAIIYLLIHWLQNSIYLFIIVFDGLIELIEQLSFQSDSLFDTYHPCLGRVWGLFFRWWYLPHKCAVTTSPCAVICLNICLCVCVHVYTVKCSDSPTSGVVWLSASFLLVSSSPWPSTCSKNPKRLIWLEQMFQYLF